MREFRYDHAEDTASAIHLIANAAQGAIATAQGLGAFLSNSVAGYLAKARGDDFTFLTLAAIVPCLK